MMDLIGGMPCEVQLIMDRSLKLFLSTTYNLNKPDLNPRLIEQLTKARADREHYCPYLRIKIDGEINDPCNWLLAYVWHGTEKDAEGFRGYSLIIDYHDDSDKTNPIYRMYYAIGVCGEDGFYSLSSVKRKLFGQKYERLLTIEDLEAGKIDFKIEKVGK